MSENITTPTSTPLAGDSGCVPNKPVCAMQGWQCPVCKAVNAPQVAQCPCGGGADRWYPSVPVPYYPPQQPPQQPPWWLEPSPYPRCFTSGGSRRSGGADSSGRVW